MFDMSEALKKNDHYNEDTKEVETEFGKRADMQAYLFEDYYSDNIMKFLLNRYEREAKNREKEKEAYKICLEKIKKHNLTMKLIKVEYTFDNNKVLFYFTADGRIYWLFVLSDVMR